VDDNAQSSGLPPFSQRSDAVAGRRRSISILDAQGSPPLCLGLAKRRELVFKT